jgi:hypothetical protein
MTPLLTLFSSPKPFVDPHIDVIQRNAVRSWLELGSEVEVVLLGNEKGVAEVCRELNVKYLPDVKTNNLGTPLISSLFTSARRLNDSPLLAYVNTDILLFDDFLESAKTVHRILDQFLLVGQRWDMDIANKIDFSSGWQQKLRQECRNTGSLHKPMGSDYFIFPRNCFMDVPDFAVGRAGWDNWMIYESRRRGWKTIDATQEIMIIHQNHDYAHLPDSKPHYRLPETSENVRMAGGKRSIFHLRDTDFQLQNSAITPKMLTIKRFWRELEIFPLVRLKSHFLGEVAFALFHPRKAYEEFRVQLRSRRTSQKPQE